jgi:hypothetical protein
MRVEMKGSGVSIMSLRNKLFQHLALAAACVLGAAGVARADNPYVFSTAGFAGNAAGPFFLDFQLFSGAANDNTVILSGFNFGGGAAGAVYTQSASTSFISLPAIEPAGGAGGSAASAIILTDDPTMSSSAAPFNELIEAFTPGSSVSFDFNSTTNLTNSSTATPDEFSFAILDHNGDELATNAPDGVSLLTATFNQPAITIDTYATSLKTTVVPLPAAAWMGLAILPLLAFASRRYFSARAVPCKVKARRTRR